MEKEYEKIKEDYLRISSETRTKLTAISLTVIAAIYFFLPSSTSIVMLKVAFALYILTIFLEIFAGFLKSQHYAQWFERKIQSLDYRESIYGKLAEYFFWIPLTTFLAASTIFFIAIFI
jgi:hypothetical protein